MYLEVLLTNHDGRQLGDSLGRSSFGRNMLRGPPFNSPIGSCT
jgi:hypothetical protein